MIREERRCDQKRQGEFEAGEGQEEQKMDKIEEPGRVCSSASLVCRRLWFGCRLLCRGLPIWARLWQVCVQIDCLGDNEQQRKARGRCERISYHSRYARKSSSQCRTEGESDAEARAHDGHGGASLRFITDVCRDGGGQLDIPFTQTAHYPAPQE